VFVSYATLFINLTPLPLGPPLILITLSPDYSGLAPDAAGSAIRPLFVSLTLLIKYGGHIFVVA